MKCKSAPHCYGNGGLCCKKEKMSQKSYKFEGLFRKKTTSIKKEEYFVMISGKAVLFFAYLHKRISGMNFAYNKGRRLLDGAFK